MHCAPAHPAHCAAGASAAHARAPVRYEVVCAASGAAAAPTATPRANGCDAAKQAAMASFLKPPAVSPAPARARAPAPVSPPPPVARLEPPHGTTDMTLARAQPAEFAVPRQLTAHAAAKKRALVVDADPVRGFFTTRQCLSLSLSLV